MQEITISKQAVNVESLDETLRTALGSVFAGVSIGNGLVTAYLEDSATPEEIEQVNSIVVDHDPNELTLGQQAEVERQQQLEQMREDHAEPLDTSAYAGQDPLIGQLATRLAWLEQEIADLRGVRA